MFDSKRILDQLVGSGFAGGLAGGAAGAALVNALSGKKARKYAGTALKAGGLALVGGLAYKAWQQYQGGRADDSQPVPSAFVPPTPQESNPLSLLLVKAMIAAARADGNIDSEEHQAIMSRIAELNLDDADKAYLFEQFAMPVNIQALAEAADTAEHAAEVYAASSLMLSRPSPGERHYLDNLAHALQLDAGLRAEIDRAVDEQQAAA
jgi:uncharacterized membrane protein YebE (DUF533 family)